MRFEVLAAMKMLTEISGLLFRLVFYVIINISEERMYKFCPNTGNHLKVT
jgi:hypothetical protein